jgi:type VI protein secretion system component Hcp
VTTQTNLKAGRRNNRSVTQVRDAKAANLKVKTNVRAGERPTETVAFYYSKISWKQ